MLNVISHRQQLFQFSYKHSFNDSIPIPTAVMQLFYIYTDTHTFDDDDYDVMFPSTFCCASKNYSDGH